MGPNRTNPAVLAPIVHSEAVATVALERAPTVAEAEALRVMLPPPKALIPPGPRPFRRVRSARAAEPHVSTPATPSQNLPPEHGPMNFNPPATMKVGDSITVDVAIRRPGTGNYDLLPADNDARLKYGLQGTGPMQGVDVLVADNMNVTLRSGVTGAFNVVPLDAQVKTLQVGGHAEWHWTVTALLPGQQELILHSQRVPHDANGRLLPPEDDGSRPAMISVTVLPPSQWILAKAEELLKEFWKAIAGAIGSAIAAIIAYWWKKKTGGAAAGPSD